MSERGGGRERREVGNKPDAEERDKEKRGGRGNAKCRENLDIRPESNIFVEQVKDLL